MAKRSKRRLEADIFRARVLQLLKLPDADWRDWELDWLESEAIRPEDYTYTDKERVILNQLIASATPFNSYNGYSIQELIDIAHAYHADLDEYDEEFVEQLWKCRPLTLRVRQLSHLASLARLSAPIGWDEQVQAVLREAWGKDDDLHREPPEWGAYL
jgi:hypothetical protein